MKKPHLLRIVCAGIFAFITVSANAALIGVLPATPGGTDWQAYYDDVADLTWLADANYAQTSGYTEHGFMNWEDANAWAAGLDVAGVTGWRLPSSLNSDGSGPCGPAYNCSDSEMGNLFYSVLGNTAGSLTNTAPFSYVQSDFYWSSTEYAPNTNYAWAFNFFNGYQDSIFDKRNDGYVWAVQSGDVGAVPVPAALWLFGSGLLGLVGMARRKKAT